MRSARRCPVIEFRRRNVTGDRRSHHGGNPYIVLIRTPEILDKLEHPIWKERADKGARTIGRNSGRYRRACATKDYGTGGDGTLASVEIDRRPDTIHSDYVGMGTGIGTALANRSQRSGSVADEVALAQVDTWSAGARDFGDPTPLVRAGLGSAQSTLGACNQYSQHCLIGAHVGTHAAAEAARISFTSVYGRGA
jgi:hypothetical protein